MRCCAAGGAIPSEPPVSTKIAPVSEPAFFSSIFSLTPAQQLGDHFTIFTLGKGVRAHDFRCAVGIETNGRGTLTLDENRRFS